MNLNVFLRNNYNKQIIIFSFICFIAFINFGYYGLKFSISDHKSLDNDAWIYLTMVRDGIFSIPEDFRSSRILTPFLANILSVINEIVGIKNIPQLNLLMVNATFFSFSILVFGLYLKLFKLEKLFVISTFILTINFATINYLAQSLVETAEVFFYICLLYALEKKQNNIIFFIFFFGALNKILFLIGGGAILIYYQIKFLMNFPLKYNFINIIIKNFVIAILSLAPFIIINFFYQNGIENTINTINRHQDYVPNFNNIRGFLYVHLLFLPLGLYGLWSKDKHFFKLNLIILIPILSFGIIIGADAVSWGRYIFSSCCFLLSVGCAYVIHDEVYNK